MEIVDAGFDEFLASITPDVLGVLNRERFFEKLENVVFPAGDDGPRLCDHSYEHTIALLTSIEIDEEHQADVIDVFQSQGGMCDCEVLLNVDDRDDCPDLGTGGNVLRRPGNTLQEHELDEYTGGTGFVASKCQIPSSGCRMHARRLSLLHGFQHSP